MSTENLELVRRLYGWMAAGEVDRAFEVYDSEIEWDGSAAPWLLDLGFEPLYRGHDQVRKALGSWLEAWKSIDYRLEQLIDAGDDVLAFVRVTALGRTSGVEVVYEHPQIWTVRNGKIVQMRVFGDRDGALRAVGLS